jgi:hypothetical protein
MSVRNTIFGGKPLSKGKHRMTPEETAPITWVFFATLLLRNTIFF